jgi:hypothetical protein
LETGDPAIALRTVTNLRRFWGSRDRREGVRWLDKTLATGAGTASERAKGSLAAAEFTVDRERHLVLLKDAIELVSTSRDDAVVADAYGYWGAMLEEPGETEGALAKLRRCRELVPGITDPLDRAGALRRCAWILMHTGSEEEADELNREALAR